MDDMPRKRDSTVLFLMLVLPALLVTVWALFRYGLRPQDSDVELSPERAAAFNLAEAPPAERPVPAPARQAPGRTRPAPRGSGGLSGFVAEPVERFSGPDGASGSDRERAFLARHGKELLRYQTRLDSIAMKYYKGYPIVRKVDSDFASLGRYMNVRRQYDKDGDPYKFVREALSLPEVRSMARQYALNADVWRVAIRMSLETLRNPPPKPVYDEVKRFVTTDKTMVGFLNDTAKNVAPKIPEVLAREAADGTDLRPLQQLVDELNAPIKAQASAQGRGGP